MAITIFDRLQKSISLCSLLFIRPSKTGPYLGLYLVNVFCKSSEFFLKKWALLFIATHIASHIHIVTHARLSGFTYGT